jgi:putative acyl-CoA dehydrogenase
MARLLRESPLNGIWEGSGTVTAMDSLRAMHRSPKSRSALLDELGTATGTFADYDHAVRRLAELLDQPLEPVSARRTASLAARTLAGSLLIRQAPGPVADLYCATRLAGYGDRVFGELPAGVGSAAVRDVVAAITPEIET